MIKSLLHKIPGEVRLWLAQRLLFGSYEQGMSLNIMCVRPILKSPRKYVSKVALVGGFYFYFLFQNKYLKNPNFMHLKWIKSFIDIL